IRLPKQDFVKPCDCEHGAVRREIDRCNDGRPLIERGMLCIDALTRICRRVVGSAFGDPSADNSDVLFQERRFLWRHLRLLARGGRRDLLNQQGLVRVLGNDGHLSFLRALATVQQLCKIRHHVTPFGLGWLMAPLAMRLKDRPDLLKVTYRLPVIRRHRQCEGRGQRKRGSKLQKLPGAGVVHVSGLSPAPDSTLATEQISLLHDPLIRRTKQEATRPGKGPPESKNTGRYCGVA